MIKPIIQAFKRGFNDKKKKFYSINDRQKRG